MPNGFGFEKQPQKPSPDPRTIGQLLRQASRPAMPNEMGGFPAGPTASGPFRAQPPEIGDYGQMSRAIRAMDMQEPLGGPFAPGSPPELLAREVGALGGQMDRTRFLMNNLDDEMLGPSAPADGSEPGQIAVGGFAPDQTGTPGLMGTRSVQTFTPEEGMLQEALDRLGSRGTAFRGTQPSAPNPGQAQQLRRLGLTDRMIQWLQGSGGSK